MRILNFVRSRAAKVVGVVMVLGAIAFPVSQAVFAADTPDCNTNAVVWGGASTTCNTGNYSIATLQSKIQNGDGHNSGANIQGIYNGFNVNVANLGSAKDGVVTSSGDVIVNGQTVATHVWTAGRSFIQNSVSMNGVWMRPPSVSFLSPQLEAYVIMNGNTFQGAIIKSCGNPVFTVNKPFGQIFKRVVLANGSTQAADTQATAVSEATGSTFQYSVDVTNNGTADMTNTVVTDNLPAGVQLANGGNSHITFPLGTITAGNHKFFTITVKVTAAAGTCINNVASFTANQNQSGQNNAWICVTGGRGGTPTPTPSATPTPSGTPTPSATPTPSGTPTPTPVCQPGEVVVNNMCTPPTTPQTGAAGLAGMGGMGAVGYAARAYLRSKKSLLDALKK